MNSGNKWCCNKDVFIAVVCSHNLYQYSKYLCQVSEAIIHEEEEESRVDRALDEISEQRYRESLGEHVVVRVTSDIRTDPHSIQYEKRLLEIH
jgi:hypothetical protein